MVPYFNSVTLYALVSTLTFYGPKAVDCAHRSISLQFQKDLKLRKFRKGFLRYVNALH